MGFEVEKLNGCLGARIRGLDFDSELGPADIEKLRKALFEHQVVSIESRGINPDQHLKLASHFGVPEQHATSYHGRMEGYPMMVVLDSDAGSRADTWHADETFLEEPPAINILHAIKVPEFGGETAFISTAAAYDQLSPGMQHMLGGLNALHDLAMTLDWAWRRGRENTDLMADMLLKGKRSSRPVIMEHPETGRKWINVNSTYTRFIENIPAYESEALLAFIYRHLEQPEFCYRHRWQPNDVVLWDQRAIQHYGVNDFEGQRVIHRISVMS